MITVTPEDFEAHLKSIRDGGYRTLTLAELQGFMDGSFRCAEKAVVITFDDAYLDNFVYAFPLLKKYNQQAVIFAVTDWLGGASAAPLDNAGLAAFKKKPPTHDEAKALIAKGAFSHAVMNWDMARAMEESGVCEFASHTLSHAECDSLGEIELQRELGESKKILEEELKVPCEYLCWPRGRFTETAVRVAKKAGYRGCFTTERGVISRASDPMYISRIVVKKGPQWVRKRLAIYTNPMLARLYLGIKGKNR